MCNSNNGKVKNKFGKHGSNEGEFNNPYCLTVGGGDGSGKGGEGNNPYLYVCDLYNHRIQILRKEEGQYFSQWGEKGGKIKFKYPYGIFSDAIERLFYVGDRYQVHMMRMDGTCIQSLGSSFTGTDMNRFDCVLAICRIDDRLYVSDHNNKRVLVFRTKG